MAACSEQSATRNPHFSHGAVAQFGRAPESHSGGRGFDPHPLHQPSPEALRKAKAATPEPVPRRGAAQAGAPRGASGLRLGMPAFRYVYVLVSEQDATRHYTGVTGDLEDRLAHHNGGACPHTAKYRPWRIETAVAFRNTAKALAFECYLKSGSGREFARRQF
jgi:putative endonuclease